MIRSVLRLLPPLLLLSLLAACAPPPIPYDRAATPPVHSIAVVQPGFPDDPAVIVAASPGASFGLVGALIDAALTAEREKRFAAAIKPIGLAPRDEFTQALLAAVSAQGYEARLMPLKRRQGGYVDELKPDAGPPVDAWLDCYVGGWGYLAAGTGDSTPYRPILSLGCQLVRTSDHRKLMRDIVWYNPLSSSMASRQQAVTLAPDSRYAFTTSDALDADPARAVAGIRDSFTRSAGAIGELLK